MFVGLKIKNWRFNNFKGLIGLKRVIFWYKVLIVRSFKRKEELFFKIIKIICFLYFVKVNC